MSQDPITTFMSSLISGSQVQSCFLKPNSPVVAFAVTIVENVVTLCSSRIPSWKRSLEPALYYPSNCFKAPNTSN